MYKRVLFMISVILIISFNTGCNQFEPSKEINEITQTFTLYYGDSDNEKFVTEQRTMTFSTEENKYKMILEELIKGPTNKDYRRNISQETKVYGVIKQNDSLIIDFSKEFSQFGGSVAEIIGVGSVVNTMTELEDIQQVKILVEGSELVAPSGLPYGFMTYR